MNDNYVLIEYDVLGPDGDQCEVHRWIAPLTITAGELLEMAEGGDIIPDTLRIFRARGIDMTPEPMFGLDDDGHGWPDSDDDDGNTPQRIDDLKAQIAVLVGKLTDIYNIVRLDEDCGDDDEGDALTNDY